MAIADLSLPSRLLAGGGPSSPDPRVLRALSTPLIGQFDPEFTALMDDVMALARFVLRTSNIRCFPVSGLATAGLEWSSILQERWPVVDDMAAAQETREVPVQVNGKLRSKLTVPAGTSEERLKELALADEKIVVAIGGKPIVKIFVPRGQLVNIVVKG